ncbi:ABC transporter permease subunit [Paenibacillus radicis (ex Gao et al. 2016)]|uniref:Sugar ABC transporter permease n=1 Tax=Paenibacillus radicis (ex Gao et al. 2016) TaxID=1737354 RepID=A0A917LQJ1_9BACL|nr:ABC transporter permease subunit [Paenibacillus radicis (ex Gao et al. 2016)]GGG51577.1 sugar ABC transporter permease [Paenibacillus radicis (ex Gao et al. 2016)]
MTSLTVSQSQPVKKKKISRDGKLLFLLSIPFVVCMLVFNYFPVYGWVYAFFDYKPGIPLSATPFVGLEHFKEIFTSSSDLVNAFINTLAMNLLNLLFSPLAIVFAIMVNEVSSGKYKKFVQTFSTLPNFISWVLVYSLAFAFFSGEGLINMALGKLGFDYTVQPMAHESSTWMFQTFLTIWKTLGWNAIIYIAAIAGIDSELYDAARVDGASRLRTIWHITIPGVLPTFLVLTLLNISNMLSSSFDQYFVFYNPLIAGKIEVLDYYAYRMGVIVGDYPYATAVGIFKTAISIILLFSVNKISKKLRGDSLI